MLTLEKNKSDVNKKRKDEYKKNCYYKRKILLNNLINCVEDYKMFVLVNKFLNVMNIYKYKKKEKLSI